MVTASKETVQPTAPVMGTVGSSKVALEAANVGAWVGDSVGLLVGEQVVLPRLTRSCVLGRREGGREGGKECE